MGCGRMQMGSVLSEIVDNICAAGLYMEVEFHLEVEGLWDCG